MIGVKEPQAGKRRRGDRGSRSLHPRVQPDSSLISDHPGPAPESANFSAPSRFRLCCPTAARRRARRNYLDKTDAIKAPKYRQNGRLLDFDPKEKVMTEPNETTSEKEVSSKNIENKVSLKNTENSVSSKSIENKDTETNLQSKLWSSSFLKESTGEVGKDEVIAKQQKNNEYCLRDIDDKLSESTDDGGEDDTSDEDNEDSDPNKDTHAPLELMAEFLRAEMGQDYHLAKKLCQMKKGQNLEEDDQDSEGDSSRESGGESSEEPSEESSDECEDG